MMSRSAIPPNTLPHHNEGLCEHLSLLPHQLISCRSPKLAPPRCLSTPTATPKPLCPCISPSFLFYAAWPQDAPGWDLYAKRARVSLPIQQDLVSNCAFLFLSAKCKNPKKSHAVVACGSKPTLKPRKPTTYELPPQEARGALG